jgi:PHS family inorganic phosphate transporter-like MFS transporter
MLTVVFACQPLGQLTATLVALIAGARQRDGISSGATAQNCDVQCLRTLDSIWRWVVGVGVIPAVIALWFRLTIIESPRYTADIGRDSRKAASELTRYLLLRPDARVISASSFLAPSDHPENYPLSRLNSASSGAVSIASSGAVSEEAGTARSRDPSPHSINQPTASQGQLNANGVPLPNQSPVQESQVIASSPRGFSPVQHNEEQTREHFSEEEEGPPLEANMVFDGPPAPSWEDFKQYFWRDGNLRTLIATSFCWFCESILSPLN